MRSSPDSLCCHSNSSPFASVHFGEPGPLGSPLPQGQPWSPQPNVEQNMARKESFLFCPSTQVPPLSHCPGCPRPVLPQAGPGATPPLAQPYPVSLCLTQICSSRTEAKPYPPHSLTSVSSAQQLAPTTKPSSHMPLPPAQGLEARALPSPYLHPHMSQLGPEPKDYTPLAIQSISAFREDF